MPDSTDDAPPGLPSKDQILEFIDQSSGKVTKRDIARAFSLRGADKIYLKRILKELLESGALAQDHARSLRKADRLPPVLVAEFAGLDSGGDVLLKPAERHLQELGPVRIRLTKDRPGGNRRGGQRFKPMGPGDRALVRIAPIRRGSTDVFSASVLKRLEADKRAVLGIFRGGPEGGRILPVDKKTRDEYWVSAEEVNAAQDGELVEGSILPASKRRIGPRHARIARRLGDVTAPRSISLIAIHAHDIPVDFPDAALRQAERAAAPTLDRRTDLRDIPLITIDPADARDHDDAIFAEADSDPNNPGGWHAIVAIADVAHFVTPGSALDKAAKERGNSCYFPDRVVPMLPESLSADLCSLKPGEDRAVLAAHLWFDRDGNLRRHRFERGFMRSAANLAYERVQAALDGNPDDATKPLLKPVLTPLYDLFKAIMKARAKREPLELDLPERRVELNRAGEVTAITVRDRLDAHRIVEELMISANVAAAEALERKNAAVMYRVHEEPPKDKLEILGDFLKTFDLNIARGTVMKPRHFNGIMTQVADTPYCEQVSEMVLRSQTQAYYSPANQGHFGLALARYAHFTSPIRRYSDLIVHRSLIAAYGLGDDGLRPQDAGDMDDIAKHISNTERRAMAAERDATDRYVAAYLSDHVGDDLTARITGVTRFGLFAELLPSGGQGLIPISSLGPEYFHFDPTAMTLSGERTRTVYHIGDRLDVTLVEADRFTGAIRLGLVGVAPQNTGRKLGRKGRPSPAGRSGPRKRRR